MNKKNKKVISVLSTLALLSFVSTGIFAIPNDPNSFYGDVTIDNKIIPDSTLNYYLNDDLIGTKDIKNSKYGIKFDKVVLTGKNGDNIKFEFDSSSIDCASATSTIEYTYVEGEIKKLDLDFSGTNTCADTTEETETETDAGNSGGGSRGGSSSGGSGGNSNTQTEDETPLNETRTIEEIKNEKENENSNHLRTSSLIQNTQKDSTGQVEDIEVISAEKSTDEQTNLEIKKQITNNALGGNIIANTSKSLFGVIALVLCLTSFIVWRENKKRNLRKNKKAKLTDSEIESEIISKDENETLDDNDESKEN
ncbi:MAG: hypothetical protein HRU03_07130 [Nanoarchaeales archaeon]|nr:hypothetical protein [Nanoarchaeales archaeon]